jgi:hypothetical protein
MPTQKKASKNAGQSRFGERIMSRALHQWTVDPKVMRKIGDATQYPRFAEARKATAAEDEEKMTTSDANSTQNKAITDPLHGDIWQADVLRKP